MITIHTICQRHDCTTLVGPGTLLGELECVDCINEGGQLAVDQNDPESVFISKITRHHGGNCCCGSCEPSYCHECGHYQQFCTCWPGVVILSPGYCNHRNNDEWYTCGNRFSDIECRHPGCIKSDDVPF